MKTTQITERMLLDGYKGLTHGLDNISIIEGKRVIWTYRNDTSNYDGFCCVCNRESANIIELEYDRIGQIELDINCDNHPSLIIIANDMEAIVGGKV